MQVDSFRYLSRLVTRYYKMSNVKKELPIPWTPLPKPLVEARLALVTSGGLYHKEHDAPFDLEGEQREPAWGDPTFRALPVDIAQKDVGASHWHINTEGVLEDINVLLPVDRLRELVENGRVGSLAPHAYSFMGYQGFPANLQLWREVYGPQVADRLREEGVDGVVLITA